MTKETRIQKTNMDKLKYALSVDSVQEQFQNALRENAGPFVASIIDLYGSDTYLQKCDPNAVIMECLKAATLKLPINKQLGFAYVVPYGNVPQFQLGYKGYIQLAMRTGQYRFLNADKVREGELVGRNLLTGEIDLSGQATSDKVVGYFAYMELVNWFSKTVYWTVDEVTAHAKRYSKSFSNKNSAWQTDFDAMALKTVVRNLLGHYGILSVEMISALSSDVEDYEQRVEREIDEEANSEAIDIEVEVGQEVNAEGPGF